ncbi:MAG: glycosyltransferase [Pseudomonadota bacterium]
MKSMHIIGSRMLGGAESFFMRLVLGLQEGGQEVIAVSRAQSLVARELAGKVEQCHAGMSSQWDLLSRWKISQAIKRQRPDIVQTYMTRATVLTHVKPNAGTVHVARLGGYYKVKHFRHAHAWIGNTKGICDFLLKGGLPADKVFYIGNFVTEPTPTSAAGLQSLRQQLHIPPEACVISAAGRFVRKKGFDVLLQAFARLPSEIGGRPVHLVIAGDGPVRNELHALARDTKHPERIHWPGWQTNTAPYYDLADVFVCPSRQEPLGNVILEGWTHRRPVVSTATQGAEELVSGEEDGLLVPVEDPAALAQAVRQCLEDESLRRQLAEAGLRKVRQQFGKQVIVQQYLDLYRRLTA